jgi:putative hydrolase of the HAD superfamily
MAVPDSRDAAVQAWLVDLDGTLYHPGPVKRRMALELLLKAPHLLLPLRQVRRAHERLRADPAPEDRLRAAFFDWMVARPSRLLGPYANRPLLEELRQARGRGLKLALVSDYPARAKLAALDVLALFDVIVANGEPDGPARLKPDPAGYLKAAERLGLAPDRCLVLGDRPDADGLAAERAGMGFRLIANH